MSKTFNATSQSTDADEAFHLFIGNTVERAEDLYLVDGEGAFRRGGSNFIEDDDDDLDWI